MRRPATPAPPSINNIPTSGDFLMTQVKNGKLVRVYPTKPGTFDCAKKNVTEIKLDLS